MDHETTDAAGARGEPGAAAAWADAWLHGWDGPEQAALVDAYAVLVATSWLDDGAARLTSLPPPGRLVEQLTRRLFPRADAARVAVVAASGHRGRGAERSGPGWLVSTGGSVVRPTRDVRHLLVLVADEGDNEVAALVDVDAAGVGPGVGSRAGDVVLTGVSVDEADVVGAAGARATLDDALTVVDLQSGALPPDGRTRRDRLRRTAAGVAATSVLGADALKRQHDVSVAAILALTDPVAGPVAGDALRWHRRRLVHLL